MVHTSIKGGYYHFAKSE